MPWIDALLNASMIAGGMGPVDPIKTTAGKLFASFYALYSGLAIISAAGCCSRRSSIASCTASMSKLSRTELNPIKRRSVPLQEGCEKPVVPRLAKASEVCSSYARPQKSIGE